MWERRTAGSPVRRSTTSRRVLARARAVTELSADLRLGQPLARSRRPAGASPTDRGRGPWQRIVASLGDPLLRDPRAVPGRWTTWPTCTSRSCPTLRARPRRSALIGGDRCHELHAVERGLEQLADLVHGRRGRWSSCRGATRTTCRRAAGCPERGAVRRRPCRPSSPSTATSARTCDDLELPARGWRSPSLLLTGARQADRALRCRSTPRTRRRRLAGRGRRCSPGRCADALGGRTRTPRAFRGRCSRHARQSAT